MSEENLDTTLENMRNLASHVNRCPACHSGHIYTAVHVAYIFDHLKNRMDAVTSANMAEHGWHGCFVCDHQWISNPMLETAPSLHPQHAAVNNVIDLQAIRRERF